MKLKCASTKWMPNQFWHTLMLGLLLISLIGVVNAKNIADVPQIGPGAAASTGKQWPTTRFKINVSGDCIIDQMTGLMWLRDTSKFKPHGYYWAEANIYVSTQGDWCGYNDWRVPNINELLSLMNYAVSNQRLWLEKAGFIGIIGRSYWSSSHSVKNRALAAGVDFADGSFDFFTVEFYTLALLPVRGGR